MEFRLEIAFNAVAERQPRPFSVRALLLGLLMLAIPVLIFTIGAGYGLAITLTNGSLAKILYPLAALAVIFLVATVFRPVRNQPYRWIVIDEGGIRSENGQLQLSWETVSNLKLRHNVLSIACTDEDDMQVQVRTPGFDLPELETFAFACIAVAAKRRQ